ncbi:MAG TPA: CehA/McbA family metallohydrolase [Kofleriaceae bacterium]
MKRLVAALVISCSSPDAPGVKRPEQPPSPVFTAVLDDGGVRATTAGDAAAVAAPDPDAVWLRGTTHVHAAPSGDSSEPVDSVIRWYEQHQYDFIVLTDHNRVTPVETQQRLIVIPGIELTFNRKGCEPPGDESTQCRIHVNALGVTAKVDGKLEWSDYKEPQRVKLYERAFVKAQELGAAVVQLNHPQYYWGMTVDVLFAIADRVPLIEIANQQFTRWNVGDVNHPSVEKLWDAALLRGHKMWGVATDDAHDYQADGGGKYPAGGGWVMVKARRDPNAILAALAAGQFYSSTGVTLSRAERVGDELVVDVAPGTTNQYAITFIENGKVVATVKELNAKRAIPWAGYVRAVVTRDDGKQAWVQPVRH